MNEIALKDTLSGHRVEGPLVPTAEIAVAKRVAETLPAEATDLQNDNSTRIIRAYYVRQMLSERITMRLMSRLVRFLRVICPIRSQDAI